MKKVITCILLLLALCVCSFSSFVLLDMTIGYATSPYPKSAGIVIYYSLFFCSALYGVGISIFLLVKVSRNAHHAARLTYEEYKERAKQKKLEKTRKKMQELEEKLQKESTE